MLIKIARTDKELSATAGLIIFKQLADSVGIDRLLAEALPKLKLGSAKSLRKFRQLLLAFQAGADCLEDLDKLAEDEAFQAVSGGKVYSAKAFGDFLRSFGEMHCKRLNHRLIELAFELRQQLFSDRRSITVDIDSTTNEQHAKKMEGRRHKLRGYQRPRLDPGLYRGGLPAVARRQAWQHPHSQRQPRDHPRDL